MLLERFKVCRVGPFEELEVSLLGDDGRIRRWVAFHGEGGTGKSTLAAALAATRPGRCVPQGPRDAERAAYVTAAWKLGVEDPDRPHALTLLSPNVTGTGPDDALRRREQALFERRATRGQGFTFAELPADRYFGRGAWALSDPTRTVLRYDVRASLGTEASRLDLARPVKQLLVYAGASSAVATNRKGAQAHDPRRLQAAIDAALEHVLAPTDHAYLGLNGQTLEPTFASPSGSHKTFDRLPTQLKHLIAMVIVPIRALWASQPGVDPREAEGVMVVDDPESGLPQRLQESLAMMLRQALPRVQWIVMTASSEIAATSGRGAVFALRRLPDSDQIQLFRDELAVTH